MSEANDDLKSAAEEICDLHRRAEDLTPSTAYTLLLEDAATLGLKLARAYLVDPDRAAFERLRVAADNMLQIVHKSIDDLGAKSHCHDVQAALAFHSQELAAALAAMPKNKTLQDSSNGV